VLTFLLAGLIFSLVNAVVRPMVMLLSLQFMLLTLGLFTLIINGFLVWLAIVIATNLTMGFWGSVAGGIILSLINFLINGLMELTRKEEQL
jgi:putative membrane protein